MSKLEKLLIGIGVVSAAFVAGAVFYEMHKKNEDNPCHLYPEDEYYEDDPFEDDLFEEDEDGADESADSDSKDS